MTQGGLHRIKRSCYYEPVGRSQKRGAMSGGCRTDTSVSNVKYFALRG